MTEVEYTDEFGVWWDGLSEAEQESVAHGIGLLEAKGATLGHPYSSGVVGSRHSHMRELRIQHQGHPVRVFYAFDPRRTAILLIAGDKIGDDRTSGWFRSLTASTTSILSSWSAKARPRDSIPRPGERRTWHDLSMSYETR